VSQKEPKTTEQPVHDTVLEGELVDLKKDMQQAKIADWMQRNQQALMLAVGVVVMVMFAVGLWADHQKKQKESAAMMYYQGIANTDASKQKVLLEKVITDYGDTGYAILAHLRLAPEVDTDKHLQALMDHASVAPELRWQAELDLAEYWIEQGKLDQARQVLNKHVGQDYAQYYYYLLSKTATGDAQKEALQKSLDAVSHDEVLKERVATALAQLH